MLRHCKGGTSVVVANHCVSMSISFSISISISNGNRIIIIISIIMYPPGGLKVRSVANRQRRDVQCAM